MLIKTKLKKIAILYICTGKYSIFWKNFFITCELYFIPEEEKKYFVFTDAGGIFEENNDKVFKVYQKKLGWPYDTLMRFHMFKNVINELEKFDYIFFFNANTIFTQKIGNEFLPKKEGLLAVLHPGFFDGNREKYTYEINPKSTAYIPANEGKFYFMGGVNGGQAKNYLQLILEISIQIDLDLKNKIIAVWHDESHLNKYLLKKDVKILSPSYGYPEDWIIPFEKTILILNKQKWGGHILLRSNRKTLRFLFSNKITNIKITAKRLLKFIYRVNLLF